MLKCYTEHGKGTKNSLSCSWCKSRLCSEGKMHRPSYCCFSFFLGIFNDFLFFLVQLKETSIHILLSFPPSCLQFFVFLCNWKMICTILPPSKFVCPIILFWMSQNFSPLSKVNYFPFYPFSFELMRHIQFSTIR